MKVLVNLALLATFATAVFVQREVIGVSLYWSLFLIMFALLALHWLLAYWVSRQAATKAVGQELLFSLHCAKIPVAESEDLVRGRLGFTEKDLFLVQKVGSRHYRVVWSLPLQSVHELSFEKFSALKSGFVLEVEPSGSERFVSSSAKRKAKLLQKYLQLSS